MASSAPYARMSDAGEAPKAAMAEIDSDSEAEAPQVGCGTKILSVGKRIGIQGVGFFSDAYDLFIINIVIAIIGKESALESWCVDLTDPEWFSHVAALRSAPLPLTHHPQGEVNRVHRRARWRRAWAAHLWRAS